MRRRDDLTPYLLEEFVQTNPFWRCCRKNGPCADHRCSFQCRNRWAATERAALVQTLTELDGASIVAGNLAVHTWTGVEDHRAARKRFNRLLRDACRSLGIVVKHRCYTHVTWRDSDRRSWFPGVDTTDYRYASAHYDFMAYCNPPRPVSDLRKLIAECWSKAWNNLPTEIKIDPVEPKTVTHHHGAITIQTELTQKEVIDWIAKYTVKNLEDVKTKTRHVYLLARNGLDLVWGSNGFFRGRNRRVLAKQFWDGICEELPSSKPAPINIFDVEIEE